MNPPFIGEWLNKVVKLGSSIAHKKWFIGVSKEKAQVIYWVLKQMRVYLLCENFSVKSTALLKTSSCLMGVLACQQ
jgi:hypothetical protein